MINLVAVILKCTLISSISAASPAAKDGPDRPAPEKMEWGKDVNGLAVAITPVPAGQGRFLVRWKNVGKETLEVPWVRFGSHLTYKNADALKANPKQFAARWARVCPRSKPTIRWSDTAAA